MSEFKFVSVPRKLRKVLLANRLNGHSKKLTAVEANEAIMQAAHTLAPDEKYKIGIRVTENSRSWDLETELSNVQANDGLYSLISPLVSDDNDNSKLLRTLLTDISVDVAKAEAARQKDDDDSDDPNNWVVETEDKTNSDGGEKGDQEQDGNDQSAVSDASSNKAKQDESKKDEEHKELPQVLSSKKINPSGEFFNDSSSISGIGQDTSEEEIENGTDDALDRRNDQVQGSQRPKPTKNVKPVATNRFVKDKARESKETELISASSALDLSDIYRQIPKEYDAENFAAKALLKNLGYQDDPADDYQRELNLSLEKKADELGLGTLAGDYNQDVQKIKQNVAKHLTDYYHKINAKTPRLAAQEKSENALTKLKETAKNNKEEYRQLAQNKKANNLESLTKQVDADVEEYRRKRNEEKQVAQSKFSSDLDHEVNKHNELVDQDLFDDTQRAKKATLEAEVNQRNSLLNSERLDVTNKFSEYLDQNFNKYNSKFNSNTSKLKEYALEINQKISERKALDEKQERQHQDLEASRLERKRTNDLKEKELEQTAKKDADFPTALAEAFNIALEKSRQTDVQTLGRAPQSISSSGAPVNYLYPISLDSPNDANNKITELEAEISRLKCERESEKIRASDKEKLNNVKHELTKTQEKVQEANKNSKASKRRWVKYSIAVGILLLLGGAGGGYYASKTIHHNPVQSAIIGNLKKEPAKPTKAVSKNNSESNKIKSSDKEKQITKNSDPAPVNKETDNNLKNYQAAKTWQQKVDSLNAMVGQHDIRALKEVNDSDPSGLSRLYEAICLKDEPKMRQIFLYMSPSERKNMSNTARSSVALAFYNVQDWGNGWYTRYGF